MMYNRYKTVYSIEEYFEILEKISKVCVISQDDVNNSIETYNLTYNHNEKRNDLMSDINNHAEKTELIDAMDHINEACLKLEKDVSALKTFYYVNKNVGLSIFALNKRCKYQDYISKIITDISVIRDGFKVFKYYEILDLFKIILDESNRFRRKIYDFGCFHDEIITYEAEEKKTMLYK